MKGLIRSKINTCDALFKRTTAVPQHPGHNAETIPIGPLYRSHRYIFDSRVLVGLPSLLSGRKPAYGNGTSDFVCTSLDILTSSPPRKKHNLKTQISKEMNNLLKYTQ